VVYTFTTLLHNLDDVERTFLSLSDDNDFASKTVCTVASNIFSTVIVDLFRAHSTLVGHVTILVPKVWM